MNFFKNELSTLRPEMGEHVGAVFTEREGGVSSGPWGGIEGIMGLNVGMHVEDNAGCVRMNRSIVAQLTPGEPKWMTQVHGNVVVRAQDVLDEKVQADAQVTTVPDIVCAVQVADCLPILIAEVNGRGVGAIHAGWKSLVHGVIENAVDALRKELGDETAQIRAWLGPRIGAEDFEVGPEVRSEFMQRYPECSTAIQEVGHDKFLLDLAAYARLALARVGVSDVQDCALSTYADPKRFYSYRRDGNQTGRHAALIWIRSQDN